MISTGSELLPRHLDWHQNIAMFLQCWHIFLNYMLILDGLSKKLILDG